MSYSKVKPPATPTEELSGHRLIESYAGLDLRNGSGLLMENMKAAMPLAAATAKFPTLASTAAAGASRRRHHARADAIRARIAALGRGGKIGFDLGHESASAARGRRG